MMVTNVRVIDEELFAVGVCGAVYECHYWHDCHLEADHISTRIDALVGWFAAQNPDAGSAPGIGGTPGGL